MKKITLLLLLCAASLSAQKKWSVEAHYSLPVGDNVYADNYTGLVDAGFKWAFVSVPVVRVGVSLNASLMYDKQLNGTQDYLTYAIPLQPRAFAEFSLEPAIKLHPSIGIGYTTVLFNSSGTIDGAAIADADPQSGVNVNLGLAYDIIAGFFVQVQYDYVKLSGNVPVKDSYNQNLTSLRAGVGVRF